MKNSVSDDLELIERLSKLIAVAFGILYVIGFLVVASHLSRYGVSSFSVLQLQYLVAGIWVLIPPAVLSANPKERSIEISRDAVAGMVVLE